MCHSQPVNEATAEKARRRSFDALFGASRALVLSNRWGPFLLLATCMVAANVAAGCVEEEIAIGEVPGVVIAAGSHARDGFVAASSSLIRNGDETIYELEGRANGQPIELRIAPDGTVLAVEEDDDE